MRVPFLCTSTVVHLHRRKRFEVVLGSQPIPAVSAKLSFSFGCVPDIQGTHWYLCTLFVFPINRKIASQLQSYASVSAEHAWLLIGKIAAGSSGG